MKHILTHISKVLILSTFVLGSTLGMAQNINLVASVDETPPLSIGQTFNYTIEAVAGTTAYRGVQIYLNYNPAIIQINSLTPNNSVLNVPLANDTSTPGIIRYAAGAFSDITGTTTVFTVSFEVISVSEGVMITHDLFENGNPNGTGVTNTLGQNILGTANNILLETLAVEYRSFSDIFSIYPNPVKGVLHIKTSIMTELSGISFYTLEGKLVFEDKEVILSDNGLSLDVSNKLINGLYLMTLTSTLGEQATYKIIVNK
ncbi:T9SS type A sorting domain-containing protein [Formosa maritima]|nr:T9SS type A sorting domain-containing protein [Formosa maritima]